MKHRIQLCLLTLFVAPLSLPAAVMTQSFGELKTNKTFSAPATLITYEHSDIVTRVMGEVKSVQVRPGDLVKKGDLLLQLDCADLKRHQRQADTVYRGLLVDVEHAKGQLQRANTLLKKNFSSKEVSEERQNSLNKLKFSTQSAKINLEQANVNVSRCDVKAPFDGIVTERYVSAATFVSQGTPVIKLLNIAALEVEAELSAKLLESVTSTTKATFSLGASSKGVSLRAQLPIVDGINGVSRAYFTLSDTLGLTNKVGGKGRVEWQDQVSYIEPSYLVKRDGQLGVMVASNSKAQFFVIPTAAEGRLAPLALPDNVQIIVQGQHSLADGDDLSSLRDQEQADAEAATE